MKAFSWLYRLLAGFLIALFLFLLPGRLVLLGTEKIRAFQDRRDQTRREERCQALLNELEQRQNPERFYHLLFSEVCRRAETAPALIPALQRAKAAVRACYGPYFRWVVWDAQGREMAALTDEQGYAYLKKQLLEGLQRVKSWFEGHSPSEEKVINVLTHRTLKQLRSFIGPFLVADHLVWPLRGEHQGELVYSAPENPRSHFWYHLGKTFNLVVFVDDTARQKQSALHFLVRRLNGKFAGQHLWTGLYHPNQSSLITPPPPFLPAEMLQGHLEHLWKDGLAQVSTSDLSLVTRPVGQNTLGYSVMIRPTARGAFYRLLQVIPWVTLLLECLCLSLFFLVYVMQRPVFLPIQAQIGVIFLYAAGLPLAVIFYLSYFGLIHLEEARFNELRDRGVRILDSFDQGFTGTFPIIERKIARIQAKLEALRPGIATDAVLLDEANRLAGDLHPDTALAVSLSGSHRFLTSQDSRYQSWFFLDFGQKILALYNFRPQTALFTGVSSTIPLIERRDPRLAMGGRMNNWNFGIERLKFIWNVVFDSRDGRVPLFFSLAWDSAMLEEQYIKRHVLAAQRAWPGLRVIARNRRTNDFIPGLVPTDMSKPRDLLRSLANQELRSSKIIRWRGERFLALHFPGQELGNFQLLGLFPLTPQEHELATFRKWGWGFGVVAVFLGTFLTVLLSRSFLVPIGHLQQGTQAILDHRFQYRLTNLPNDEMGVLGNFFNHAMISLEEFSKAHIIHQSLFPAGPWLFGSCRVSSHALSRQELPGHFLDVFPLPGNRCGLLLGRLADTGPSGALQLGLIKSIAAGSPEDQHAPARLLSRIHQAAMRLGTHFSLARASLLYALLDGKSGELCLAQTGFPPFFRFSGPTLERVIPGGSSGQTGPEMRVQLTPDSTLLWLTTQDRLLPPRFEPLLEAYLRAHPPAEDPVTWGTDLFPTLFAHRADEAGCRPFLVMVHFRAHVGGAATS